MSANVQRLQYRNKRKIALHRLPFVGKGGDFWAVPATGGYAGGYRTGEAMAVMYLKYLREHGEANGSQAELMWIVDSLITRAGGSLDVPTPEGDALTGQAAGFFGLLNAWLLRAAKGHGSRNLDVLTEAELLQQANDGLQLPLAAVAA